MPKEVELTLTSFSLLSVNIFFYYVFLFIKLAETVWYLHWMWSKTTPTTICPPGLHISLGLFLKHFNSLEVACSELDVKIASTLARSSKCQGEEELGQRCQDYIKSIRSAVDLEEQASAWQQNAEHLQEQLTATLLEVPDGHDLVELLNDSI